MLVTKKFVWTVYFIQNYSCKFSGTPTMAQLIFQLLKSILASNNTEFLAIFLEAELMKFPFILECE